VPRDCDVVAIRSRPESSIGRPDVGARSLQDYCFLSSSSTLVPALTDVGKLLSYDPCAAIGTLHPHGQVVKRAVSPKYFAPA